MKLLLDEMWSPAIAAELRARGHDVVAACEPRWAERYRGVDDRTVLEGAQRDERAVVTDNIEDYRPLQTELEARGEAHRGLIYALRPSFDRSQPELVVGRIVRALDAFLQTKSEEAPFNRGHYLRPA